MSDSCAVDVHAPVVQCGCLRFVEPGSATQIIIGIVFCIGYLSLIAYLTPYADDSDDFFSTVCQVQTLFVLLAALIMLMRNQLVAAAVEIEKLHGPKQEDTVAGEAWFTEAVAIMVRLPLAPVYASRAGKPLPRHKPASVPSCRSQRWCYQSSLPSSSRCLQLYCRRGRIGVSASRSTLRFRRPQRISSCAAR